MKMIENIEVFTQSSIRIRCSQGTVYIDPFKMEDSPSDAGFILITHDHMDHFSLEDIEKTAGESCVLIVPERMEGKAKEAGAYVKKTVYVKPGESYDVDGLKFKTVPAYNLLKPFHPKSAGWVGYILEADDRRIYIAGDTDAVKEAKTVQCDVALVPIGGTFTMNAKKAAELVNAIKPAVAIPTHYGSIVGKKEDAEEFKAQVDPSIQVTIFDIGQ